jgi:hypothetical protein
MLSTIYEMLPKTLVRDEWLTETDDWGDRVKLFRDYYDGNHRSKLTGNMKRMLRISGDAHDQFNENYCGLVVDTYADRLLVERMQGDSDEATMWATELMDANRFDGLQMDIHEATIRDGDTFVLLEYDNETDRVVFSHEPCWNGETGMIAVYDRRLKNILIAVKVWYEGLDDARRVNFYYPDRVEKYIGDESGYGMQPYVDDSTDERGIAEWLPGVVPVIHYRNRMRTMTQYGISELASVVPLQDALNRGLMSMVMTAELTAFLIRVAKGFEPPAEVSPGMWITIGAEGLSNDQVADAFTLEPGGIVPFIDQANHLIEQIATISRTPLPTTLGGDSASGEALKQRESGLLAKVRKAQVKVGNSHEDLMRMAVVLHNTFSGTRAPVSNWRCVWRDAQVRNEAQMIQNALAVRDIVGERETLRLIAEVYGYGMGKQEEIQQEKRAQTAQAMSALAGSLPGFDNFNV